jgi:hypothetical protein
MTENDIRNLVINAAKKYIGCGNKSIVDIYNAHKPLARGYKVQYTDAWCATFVSTVGIVCGLTDIMPTECGCPKMISLYKALGRWEEGDSYLPSPGDIIMYDWQDTGKGENAGNPDHVGIVEKVDNGWMTIIEGNYSHMVKRRTLAVNGKYIRGYCLPDYASKATITNMEDHTMNIPTLKKGSKGETVRAMQTLLIGYGYTCGCCGADGDFGEATQTGLRNYQLDHRLTVDGICGQKTWSKLLGVM